MANNLPALFASNANLPAHLRTAGPVANALAEHYTAGFSVLSIKGKVWTVVKGDEKNVLMNPKDPDSVASSIELVILKASPIKHKVWYAGSFKDGEEAGKPDCFSTDGVAPDPQSEKPQAKKCALCPKNQWGSKISADGAASKGKACNDTIRMAVAAASALDEPMLLRIPPASIKAAGEFGSLLAKRGVPLEAVLTKLKFDPEAPTPKVMFEPVGFLDAAQYAAACESRDSDTVEAILAVSPVTAAAAADDDGVLGAIPDHLKAATAAAKQEAAQPTEPAAPVKTAEELEAEEEERQLQEMLARKAARQAGATISKAKEVTADEIKAAVAAGEAGAAVTPKATTTRKAAAPKATPAAATDPEMAAAVVAAETSLAAGGGAIEVEGIPDLSNISFDD